LGKLSGLSQILLGEVEVHVIEELILELIEAGLLVLLINTVRGGLLVFLLLLLRFFKFAEEGINVVTVISGVLAALIVYFLVELNVVGELLGFDLFGGSYLEVI